MTESGKKVAFYFYLIIFERRLSQSNDGIILFFIAGPCVVESRELLIEIAGCLKEISTKYGVEIIFKSSYKKANRTSINSFTGIGDKKALEFMSDIKDEFGFLLTSDFHSVEEANLAGEYVDILQVPAYLSRQTPLLIAAGETGKTVNIKKAQFMAPADVIRAAEKVKSTGNDKIWLTERGTFFGYNNLVVDFRSLVELRKSKYKVIYDATHSLQQPSIGEQSGGTPEMAPHLARAAAAVGVDGIFFEVHPEPSKALSDSATQLRLDNADEFIRRILEINTITSNYNQ